MKGALADVPPTPFRVASGIELVSTDAVTGQPAGPSDPNAIMEAFKAGTAPGEPNAPGAAIIGQAAATAPPPPPPHGADT